MKKLINQIISTLHSLSSKVPIIIFVILIVGFIAGCNNGITPSDTTPPKISLVKWEQTQQGTQGAQTTFQPGSIITVPSTWLGNTNPSNKADIRIYADDKEGVSKLEVTGITKGVCSTIPDSKGLEYRSPGILTSSLPVQTAQTTPGYVMPSLTLHLDQLLANGSCGVHQYNGMPQSKEFFIPSGTWTITVHAENCCGGQTNATFTIIVR